MAIGPNTNHAVWGDEAEVVRLALEWTAQRVVRNADPWTTAHPETELAAAAGKTIVPGGIGAQGGAARVLRGARAGDPVAG